MIERRNENLIKRQFVIYNTNKYGKGVFAKHFIKKGSVIHVLSGKKVTLNQLVINILKNKEKIDDPFQIGRRTYIDLDKISRTFNHCCDPSAGIRKESELFALNDIIQGEEITYDYSMTIAPTEWSMRCKCGSKKCRKIIHDIRSIPHVQLQKYVRAGAVQKYMKPLLRMIELNRYEMSNYEILALKKLSKIKND